MHKTFRLTLLLIVLCLATPFANETTPSALWTAFKTDATAFRENIGNKVTISAIVADTHISVYLTPVVSLVDKSGDEVKVICVLPRLDAGKLSSFKSGEKVKMVGNLYAAREEKIVIKQCQAEGK
jgi:hypothetical protein